NGSVTSRAPARAQAERSARRTARRVYLPPPMAQTAAAMTATTSGGMPASTWGARGAAGAAARGAAAGAGMAGASAGRALGVPDDARLRFRANRPKARPATAITIIMMVLESMVHPPVIVPGCGTLGVFLHYTRFRGRLQPFGPAITAGRCAGWRR